MEANNAVNEILKNMKARMIFARAAGIESSEIEFLLELGIDKEQAIKVSKALSDKITEEEINEAKKVISEMTK